MPRREASDYFVAGSGGHGAPGAKTRWLSDGNGEVGLAAIAVEAIADACVHAADKLISALEREAGD